MKGVCTGTGPIYGTKSDRERPDDVLGVPGNGMCDNALMLFLI